MSEYPGLTEVRGVALALRQTEERLSHGQPTFFVGGKQFAQYRAYHHGDERIVVCVRTSGVDEQAMLIDADPDLYSRPAYLGPAGWVAINLSTDVDWDHVADRLKRSWELAAPKASRR